MSITPAFSPGPWITQGALVGSVRRWTLEDLYEQCSFHIAEKMPSSVKLGVREISAGVMVGCLTGFLLAMRDGPSRPLLGESGGRRKGLIHTIFWAGILGSSI